MARLVLLFLCCFQASPLSNVAADESSASESSVKECDEKLFRLTEINARNTAILLEKVMTFQWHVKELMTELKTDMKALQQDVNTLMLNMTALQQDQPMMQKKDIVNLASAQNSSNLLSSHPASCDDVVADGIVSIFPPPTHQPVPVYCDQLTRGGGWTVILRRVDGEYNFPQQTWSAYKSGFGDLRGSFWLGLETMHHLTHRTPATLRVELEDWEGETRYAEYSHFSIASEEDGYRLSVAGYSGDAGDSLVGASDWGNSNGQQFSTFDRDNDPHTSNHCAESFNGAWWYNKCMRSCLTGEYLPGDHQGSKDWEGLLWNDWRGKYYSYKRAEMKIRHR